MPEQKQIPATPAEAEKMAMKAVGDYLTACRMTDQAQIGNYLMKICSVAGAAIQVAAASHERPSVLYRPSLTVDGNQWCAIYGENLQDGVAGFGNSPADAMWDFDRNWVRGIAPKAAQPNVRVEGLR